MPVNCIINFTGNTQTNVVNFSCFITIFRLPNWSAQQLKATQHQFQQFLKSLQKITHTIQQKTRFFVVPRECSTLKIFKIANFSSSHHVIFMFVDLFSVIKKEGICKQTSYLLHFLWISPISQCLKMNKKSHFRTKWTVEFHFCPKISRYSDSFTF